MFDVEVGVSQKVVDNLNRRLIARLLGKRAIRIYNAINLQRFEDLQVDRLAKRRGLGLKREALVVGAVGRLTKQKGYAILLDAAALVLKKLPQTRFLIIGSGELQGELKRHAQSLGIDTKVIFTGARKDIEELIAVMDVFVSSSLWEGLPTAVLESMAAKVPVVATRVSGSSELINHGRTGLLVPPGDPKSLADGIMLLLTKRQKAISMGIEAYRYLKEKFSMENIAKQYATLYTSCLNEESP
jgi:glycosyltransferase involved in cell wall biosynthesis